MAAGVRQRLAAWRREDRRLFIFALNGAVFFVVLAGLLKRAPRTAQFWSTTVQLVGAVVTATASFTHTVPHSFPHNGLRSK
jgi:hypothetical protein